MLHHIVASPTCKGQIGSTLLDPALGHMRPLHSQPQAAATGCGAPSLQLDGLAAEGARLYEGQALDARARDEAPLPERAKQGRARPVPQWRGVLRLPIRAACVCAGYKRWSDQQFGVILHLTERKVLAALQAGDHTEHMQRPQAALERVAGCRSYRQLPRWWHRTKVLSPPTPQLLQGPQSCAVLSKQTFTIRRAALHGARLAWRAAPETAAAAESA